MTMGRANVIRFFTLTFTALLCFAASPLSEVPEDYWQQEVNYRMEVTLREDLRTIDGKIAIDYNNHSPDTLRVIYLKAWPNAIQKDSYADKKQRTAFNYDLANLKPEQEGRLDLFDLTEGDAFAQVESAHRTFEFDNSIITVYLNEPLPPGYACDLVFGFTTTFPKPSRMRMGTVAGVVRAAYWFPQACVYDRVLGWVDAQYEGWGENYGDYGSYDVTITAPSSMIVAATGVCVNEEEVLPEKLREMLDISNFLKPRAEWPTVESGPDSVKSWHYVAENVNDFVFTASSNWCIDSDTIDGVEVVAYALRGNAHRWQDAVRLGRESIETFSELFLPYQWPVIRICDAYSGMEYPMLTNCSGGAPSPYFPLLLYHEIGHQWFMGQIGSNQIDRPFIDEGFTTHAEHLAMEKYLGRQGNLNLPKNFYQRWFEPPITDRNERGFRPLLLLMEQGQDKPMVFAYDRGVEYWPWRVSAYYKSAAMHYSLRSILGDSAYFDAMRDYCNDWLFRHPYEHDFLRSMEQSTGLQLDEYFRQWYHGRERLDYAYGGMSVEEQGGEYVHTIKLERPGDFISPVDIAVVWEQGDTAFYTVAPEGMGYQKPNYRLTQAWKQFRTPDNAFEFRVTARRKIAKVVVDPFELLMDIDRRNNVAPILWFFPPTEVRVDNLLYDRTPIDKQAMRVRPDLWYDDVGGFQIGGHSHGSFLERRDRHSVDLRWLSRSGGMFGDVTFSGPISPFSIDGVGGQRFLWTKNRSYSSTWYEIDMKPGYALPGGSWVHVEVNFFSWSTDEDPVDRSQPLPGDLSEFVTGQAWDLGETVWGVVEHGWVSAFRYGKFGFSERAQIGKAAYNGPNEGFFENQFQIRFSLHNSKRTWLSLRGEYLTTEGRPPAYLVRHLSRAPAMDRFAKAPVFRSPGTFPTDWEPDFYLAEQRVRGYQDRYLYLTKAAGGSLEITPPDLLPFRWLGRTPLIGGWLSKVDNTLFFDFSSISMEQKEQYYPGVIRGNETIPAGDGRRWYLSSGLSLTLPPFWKGRHRVRLDFPVYLNRPAVGEKETDFRLSVAWLVVGGL
ncbi:M1 family metallopeptidase [bacterium]|nr:M1 family metallopeptidase [bacterium]